MVSHFQRGLRELDRYLFHFEEEALHRAVDAFRLAATMASDQVDHWTALGFALDASDLPGEALIALRRALELDPKDEEVEVFVLTLLSELGPESEAMAGVEALAERKGVDLASLRAELTAADMPTDSRALLMNGFLRARNFVRSRLQDAIDRSQRMRDPKGSAREAESEGLECLERQEELRKSIDPDRVPVGLRPVIPWAIRLGVGDDVCRSLLIGGLTTGEHSALLDLVREHEAAIHSWLDTFGDRPMPMEAAAYMYLLLGLEEAVPPKAGQQEDEAR